MKPTPLSSVLADDLFLDRIGARLDTDDELGSMLLAVAHHADTPITRPIVGRRARRHRGLTVLAALGVAVSGATVAAAVELGPVPPDQASGLPHSRSLLPQGLPALVMPFLNGTPFQGRLLVPNGSLPTVPTSGSARAAGLPGAVPSIEVGVPVAAATAIQEAPLDRQDQQEARQTQAKGSTAGGQGAQGAQGAEGTQGTQAASGGEPDDQSDQGGKTAAAPAAPKPPKPEQNPPTNQANRAANGHANGIVKGNGNANGRAATGSTASTGSTMSTGGTGSTGGTMSTGSVPGDPAGSGAPTQGKAKGKSGDTTSAGSGSTKSANGEAPPHPAGTTTDSTATTTDAPGSGGQ